MSASTTADGSSGSPLIINGASASSHPLASPSCARPRCPRSLTEAALHPCAAADSETAKKVRAQLAEEIKAIQAAGLSALYSMHNAPLVRTPLFLTVSPLPSLHPDGAVPSLSVILVGSRKDSQTYVSMKTKACAEVGLHAQQFDLPESTSTDELLALIQRLNADPSVSGILVQLPLPSHCDADRVIAALHPLKDVDGLTQPSAGRLFLHGAAAPLIPCTPLGCLALLDAYAIPLEGRHAVVIGRSNLVGKPVALLLLSRNATVTLVHSKTKDVRAEVSRADIVVAAIGKAEWVKGEWLKEGAVVVDVGINPKDDATKKLGYRLVGDVDFESAKGRVSAITPVPGGVGPMTVAMLLKNTIAAYRLQRQQRS